MSDIGKTLTSVDHKCRNFGPPDKLFPEKNIFRANNSVDTLNVRVGISHLKKSCNSSSI